MEGGNGMSRIYRSLEAASRIVGISEWEILTYVGAMPHHFYGEVHTLNDRYRFSGRALELLVEVHLMKVCDGLSLGQIDALLDGTPPGPTVANWTVGATERTAQFGPLLKEVMSLLRSSVTDPLAEGMARSYCLALYGEYA